MAISRRNEVIQPLHAAMSDSSEVDEMVTIAQIKLYLFVWGLAEPVPKLPICLSITRLQPIHYANVHFIIYIAYVKES